MSPIIKEKTSRQNYSILANNKIIKSFETEKERDDILHVLINFGNKKYRNVWSKNN